MVFVCPGQGGSLHGSEPRAAEEGAAPAEAEHVSSLGRTWPEMWWGGLFPCLGLWPVAGCEKGRRDVQLVARPLRQRVVPALLQVSAGAAAQTAGLGEAVHHQNHHSEHLRHGEWLQPALGRGLGRPCKSGRQAFIAAGNACSCPFAESSADLCSQVLLLSFCLILSPSLYSFGSRGPQPELRGERPGG